MPFQCTPEIPSHLLPWTFAGLAQIPFGMDRKTTVKYFNFSLYTSIHVIFQEGWWGLK